MSIYKEIRRKYLDFQFSEYRFLYIFCFIVLVCCFSNIHRNTIDVHEDWNDIGELGWMKTPLSYQDLQLCAPQIPRLWPCDDYTCYNCTQKARYRRKISDQTYMIY